MSVSIAVPIIPDYLLTLEMHELSKHAGVSDSNAIWTDQDPGSGTGRPHGNDFFDHFWNHTDFNLTYFSQLFYNLSGTGNWSDIGQGGLSVVPEQEINENPRIGWLFSSKAIVQLFANPFVGSLTNR